MENLQHKKLVDTFFFFFSPALDSVNRNELWSINYIYIYIYQMPRRKQTKYKWFSMVDMNKIKIFYFYSFLSTKNINDFNNKNLKKGL